MILNRVLDSITRRSKRSIPSRWPLAIRLRAVLVGAVCLTAVLLAQPARSNLFTRSLTPSADDLPLEGNLFDWVPRGLGSSESRGLGDRSHGSIADGSITDRLAYRADRPRPVPQGSGLVDKRLSAPRTWVISDLFHGCETITTIVEKDRLCLDAYFYEPIWSYTGDVYQDYWYFYSRKSLLCLGVGVGIAAGLANTSLDEEFRAWFQDHVATDPDAWQFAKLSGESWVVASVLLGTWAIDQWAPSYGFFRERLWDAQWGEWSRQSLRGLLVGAPVVGFLQVATGGSRPSEAGYGSYWRPLNDDNGVSGHSFVGAVPFLVAAKRVDGRLLKTAFFVGSGLAGYSRLNDDAHYLSQVLLGWWVAYLSVEATQLTEQSHLQYRLVPLTIDGLVGIGVELRY